MCSGKFPNFQENLGRGVFCFEGDPPIFLVAGRGGIRGTKIFKRSWGRDAADRGGGERISQSILWDNPLNGTQQNLPIKAVFNLPTKTVLIFPFIRVVLNLATRQNNTQFSQQSQPYYIFQQNSTQFHHSLEQHSICSQKQYSVCPQKWYSIYPLIKTVFSLPTHQNGT